MENLEKLRQYIWQHPCNHVQEVTHQNARASHSEGDGVVCSHEPTTFRKLHAILVQVKTIIGVKDEICIGREGDSVEARGDAGEDNICSLRRPLMLKEK